MATVTRRQSVLRLFMIEHHFEVPFVSRLALREKQIQQNYRPVIAVHKWFARRPGTLFRSLILSEFAERPIHQTFYQSQHMPHVRVFDPFMGGGTTMMEANRHRCPSKGAKGRHRAGRGEAGRWFPRVVL